MPTPILFINALPFDDLARIQPAFGSGVSSAPGAAQGFAGLARVW